MDVLREWWAVFAAFIAGIFWLSRLEWRGLHNSAEIKRLWKQRHEDLEAARRARDETNEILREMQRDIKLLLQQRGGHDRTKIQ